MPLFNKKVTYSRPARTQDGQAVTVEDWTTATVVAGKVPASIQQLDTSAMFEFNRRGVDADYVIFHPTNPAVQLEDRAPDPDASGFYFEVRDAPQDLAGRGRMYSVPVKRVG